MPQNTKNSSADFGPSVRGRFDGASLSGSPSWIRTATNRRPERQPGGFSRLPDEVVPLLHLHGNGEFHLGGGRAAEGAADGGGDQGVAGGGDGDVGSGDG